MGEGKNKKRKSTLLIEGLEKKNYLVIFSQFIVAEISYHLSDWFLLQKVIKSGFSYREFRSQKKYFSLDDAEKDKIDFIVQNISEKEFVNALPIKELSIENLVLLSKLMNNQIEFCDAIHLITAKNEKCDYFVTKDGDIRKKIQSLINQNIFPKMKFCTPSGFIKEAKI